MTPRPRRSEHCAHTVGTRWAWKAPGGEAGGWARTAVLSEQDSRSFSLFPTHRMTIRLWSPRTPVTRPCIEPKQGGWGGSPHRESKAQPPWEGDPGPSMDSFRFPAGLTAEAGGCRVG